MAPQQLFTWRREVLAAATGAATGVATGVATGMATGMATGIAGDGFLQVAVSEVPATAAAAATPIDEGRMEIVLPDGVVVRVGREVATGALRRVLAALR
jgi:transposase